MHNPRVDIDTDLVRRLVAGQEWHEKRSVDHAEGGG